MKPETARTGNRLKKDVTAALAWLKRNSSRKVQCGRLEDKFGVSWQVVPDELLKLWTTKDGAKAERVMKAMGKMVKLDLRKLQQAAKG